MEREKRLFEACRILFGNDISLSQEFLAYLQKEGITSAFRKRVMEVHPDRAIVSELSVHRCQEDFHSLQRATETLLQYIKSREIAFSRGLATAPSLNSQDTPSYLDYSRLPSVKLRFGRFLYRMELIEWRQLMMALAWQKSGRPRIGELGVRLGYLDRNSVLTILKYSVNIGPFGTTALHMGLLTKKEVLDLLSRQKQQERKIGQFFVEQGIVTDDELKELLVQLDKHNRRIEMISRK